MTASNAQEEIKKAQDDAQAKISESTARADAASAEARKQQAIAREQKQVAERQTRITEAQKLAAQSEQVFLNDPRGLPTSIMLALKSKYVADTTGGNKALSQSSTLLPPLLSSFPRQEGYTNLLKFSPDGDYLLTVSVKGNEPPYENLVTVWSARDQKKIAIINTHLAKVNAVEFSRDKKFLITASDDATICIWEDWHTEKPRKINCIAYGEKVIALSLNKDDTYLAAAGDSSAKLWKDWQTPTPTQLESLDQPAITGLTYRAADNTYILFSADNSEPNSGWGSKTPDHPLQDIRP